MIIHQELRAIHDGPSQVQRCQPQSRQGPFVTMLESMIVLVRAVQYGGGRHDINGASEWSPLGFIAKYKYTPWPGIKQRKLQIRSRVPLSDFQRGAGTQHNVNAEQLEREQLSIQALPHKDLADFEADSVELAMVHRVWREVLDE